MLRFLVLTTMLLVSSVALAQSVRFDLAYPAVPGYGPHVALTVGDDSAAGSGSLRLGVGTELSLGLRLREAGALATVGNLVTTLAADVSTGGNYALSLAARGVAGPAALRGRLSLSDGLGHPYAVDEGALRPLPYLGPGAALWGAELGASYRLSRDLVIDVAPGAYLRGDELGWSLQSELRLLRLVGDDDLNLLAETFAAPGGDAHLAAGVGYTLNRRRAPSWSGYALLGWDGNSVLPGARISGSERLGPVSVRLRLWAEPFRQDAWPYRIDLDVSGNSDFGAWELALLAGLVPDRGWGAGARAGLGLPLGD